MLDDVNNRGTTAADVGGGGGGIVLVVTTEWLIGNTTLYHDVFVLSDRIRFVVTVTFRCIRRINSD